MGSGQITQNQINLNSIEIFQFSLKIYEQMYECMGGLKGRLM